MGLVTSITSCDFQHTSWRALTQEERKSNNNYFIKWKFLHAEITYAESQKTSHKLEEKTYLPNTDQIKNFSSE